MRRIAIQPRPDWQNRVEQHGFHFHTPKGEPYWDESACWQLTCAEVDGLEVATNELHQMCLELVQDVIDNRQLHLFQIPGEFEDWVIRSWEEGDLSIYGRFDLACDGVNPPKLLEYNADTPTALVEASIVQWHWLQDVNANGDQFNSIHEKLIEAWQALRQRDAAPIHFAAMADVVEDYLTVEYLRDTCIQAGFETSYLDVEQIGWDKAVRCFVDLANQPIRRMFKLYPWELMLKDEFGQNVLKCPSRWIEPPWKMILSCKAILPLLWQKFPESPYLLPASFEEKDLKGSFIRKPLHGREGANVQVVVDGQVQLETDGPYTGPFVYQQLARIEPSSGRYPIFGSWIVNGVSCGVGIREDDSIVTTNLSRFVPHEMID